MSCWCGSRHFNLASIQPGTPTQNAFLVSASSMAAFAKTSRMPTSERLAHMSNMAKEYTQENSHHRLHEALGDL
jgi:hypothetical protein